jgi:ClpP class serine protease
MKFTRSGLLAIDHRAVENEYSYTESPSPKVPIVSDVAIIDVRGPMSHHPDWFWECYDDMLHRAEVGFRLAKAVLFMGDTPGGEVSGCFSGARDLRKMADHYGKPLLWYVDGTSTSAGVAWAVACDRILIPKEGRMGSIGVIAEVRNTAKMNEAMGIETRLVTSGARKADGHPAVPFDEGAIKAIQESVDFEAKCFFEWVSERRGIPTSKIASWEAGIFHGQEAIDNGLADRITDDSGAIAFAASLIGDKGMKIKPSGGAARTSLASIQTALASLALQDTDEGREALALANTAGLDVHALAGSFAAEPAHEEPDGDEAAAEDTDKDKAEDETDGDEAVDETDDSEAVEETDEDKAIAAIAAPIATMSVAAGRAAQARARVAQLRKQAAAFEASATGKSNAAMSALVDGKTEVAKRLLAEANALRAKAVDHRSRATDVSFAADALAAAVRPVAAPKPAAKPGARTSAQVFEQTRQANAPRAVGKPKAAAPKTGLAAVPADMLRAANMLPMSSGLVPQSDGTVACGCMSPEEAKNLLEQLDKNTAALHGVPGQVGG